MNESYKRSELVDSTSVGDRTVLYHQTTLHAIVLNPTGAHVWDLLANPQSKSQLVECLFSESSNVSRAQVEKDISAYLKDLLEQGVIVVEN